VYYNTENRICQEVFVKNLNFLFCFAIIDLYIWLCYNFRVEQQRLIYDKLKL